MLSFRDVSTFSGVNTANLQTSTLHTYIRMKGHARQNTNVTIKTSFVDYSPLLVLYPVFLQHLINIAHEYSLKWRYEFNNIKSGIVTYAKSKPSHFANMQERSWTLGVETVDELYVLLWLI